MKNIEFDRQSIEAQSISSFQSTCNMEIAIMAILAVHEVIFISFKHRLTMQLCVEDQVAVSTKSGYHIDSKLFYARLNQLFEFQNMNSMGATLATSTVQRIIMRTSHHLIILPFLEASITVS